MNAALKSKITVMSAVLAYGKHGYTLFQNDAKNYNLNIFGVRSSLLDTDTFNDMICLMWKHQGQWELRHYAATTDPGLYYFEHPIGHGGKTTHIMAEGQYRRAYEVAKHQGKYQALCQKGPVDFYEDSDRDKQFDRTKIVRGEMIGANIHATINKSIDDLLTAPIADFPDTESWKVSTWSAACQVIANPQQYLDFMKCALAAKDIYGNSFTYTLFEESSF